MFVQVTAFASSEVPKFLFHARQNSNSVKWLTRVAVMFVRPITTLIEAVTVPLHRDTLAVVASELVKQTRTIVLTIVWTYQQ